MSNYGIDIEIRKRDKTSEAKGDKKMSSLTGMNAEDIAKEMKRWGLDLCHSYMNDAWRVYEKTEEAGEFEYELWVEASDFIGLESSFESFKEQYPERENFQWDEN